MNYVEIYNHGNILRGMCHRSNNSDSYPVIIVHGYFSANRIGPQRLFVKLADSIQVNGFDVYRFDLSGMGESDGDISNTTFIDHVKDVKCIIDYVQSIHNKKVILIAHCLGCNVSLTNIIEFPGLFREIIFLAPFFTTPRTISAFFSHDAIQQLSNENFAYRKGLFAHGSFFKESKQNVFIDQLNKSSVTLNVIIPERDQFIPLESSRDIFDNISFINTIYLPNADHNFLEYNNEVISCVLRLLNDEHYTI